MEKIYEAPEMSVVEFDKRDDLLDVSGEGNPIEHNG